MLQLSEPTENQWSPAEKTAIALELEHLEKIGAVVRCSPCDKQFISKIFLVPKSNGTKRLILNLKNLNTFLDVEHFKMEDRNTALKLITKNCFMGSIDLTEAYFLIPITSSHRKYLRFRFSGRLYEFTCIPFGLCTAPLVFTKLMKPVVTALRAEGLLSVVYLDDFLLIGNTFDHCQQNISRTIAKLEKLGFVINYTKSSLIPSQNCHFLGFNFNSKTLYLELPKDKQQKIKQSVIAFRNLTKCRIRSLAYLLGLLTSACPAVAYGWVYTKKLERAKYLALRANKDNYNKTMRIPPKLGVDLSWWQHNVIGAKNQIQRNHFQLTIFSDASKTGWGAVCGNKRTHGFWNSKEQQFHINQLELLAAFFGIKCFANKLTNCNILLRIDNTTAISYINRMGGVQFANLSSLARQIWRYCESRKIWIFASYITSSANSEADRESRRLRPETEWVLSQNAFNQIVNAFGAPQIDLFANRTNAKCRLFVSWMRDPEALAIDAFTLVWGDFYFYAFPPFAVIPRVLQKIITDNAEGILVVPAWPSQPWFPVFSSLLVDDPIYFEPNATLLSSAHRSHHPLWEHLTLVAGRLSHKRSSQGDSP